MTLKRPLFIAIAWLFCVSVNAQLNNCDQCCAKKGCIQYCDASAGRYVCGDGDYSACYCTRHAVMDLQKIQGCCLWQGGVMKIDELTSLVICNDGGVSEVCSIQNPVKSISMWH